LTASGKETWHIAKTADELIRLNKLLQQDRLLNYTLLTDDERAVVLEEATQAWDVLNLVPAAGAKAYLEGNNEVASSVRAAVRDVQLSPSLSSITGSTFTKGFAGKVVLETPGPVRGLAQFALEIEGAGGGSIIGGAAGQAGVGGTSGQASGTSELEHPD